MIGVCVGGGWLQLVSTLNGGKSLRVHLDDDPASETVEVR